MRALAIVHQRDAGPGVFADSFRARGARLECWMPAEGEPAPAADHDAVLVLGGAMDVDQEDRHPWLHEEKRLLRSYLQREAPVLGVCLGAQLLAEAAGAVVGPARRPEIGWFEVQVTSEGVDDPLLGP